MSSSCLKGFGWGQVVTNEDHRGHPVSVVQVLYYQQWQIRATGRAQSISTLIDSTN